MPIHQISEVNQTPPPRAAAPLATELAVTGMTCGNCARHVTEAIQKVSGVRITPWFKWSSFAIATLVQIFAGAPFYRGAWSQIKSRSANMDTLVALGSTTAFGYSAWALLSGLGGHLYFMEAAAIITLISIGHWLESRASVRASGALRKLLNLTPPLARRLSPNGE